MSISEPLPFALVLIVGVALIIIVLFVLMTPHAFRKALALESIRGIGLAILMLVVVFGSIVLLAARP